MSIQDDAFDIEHFCKKKCPETARRFIEYTWACEEEIAKLRAKVHEMEICLKILKERSIID